jgi:predicted dehydrogenase/threonine dehydrogenase-like Zn-dependent dehydrogenase
VKQVAQNYRTGELVVLDVPPPACRSGGVMVRSLYSLISTGTELMKVTEAGKSLVGKARARPDQVRKVVDSVAQQGLRSTYTKAMHQLDSYTPLGYSLCGVVTEVGTGVDDLQVGQRVACAGNEFALHADVNWVPRNLCAPVPDAVVSREAAFATVGAIAMHGVRRAEPQIGEVACVVGLGLVGQLVVQLLVASSVRVVGLDPVEERCRMAEKAGAVACDAPDAQGLARLERVLAGLGGGLGADHVLLVAGGTSRTPVEAAARLARDRARVVDIGKLKLDLPWNAYYDKELELRFSRSYGPGRYDERYELDGADYPAGYVRWTERRNLECFLDLLAHGALSVDLLASHTFPLDEAPDVYRGVKDGTLRGVGFLFEYPDPGPGTSSPALRATEDPAPGPAASGGPAAGATFAAAPAGRDRPSASQRSRLRLGFVGAGAYASSMLLPHLASREDLELAHVVTTSSLSAANARRRFGFTHAATDLDQLLSDDLDAVFVVTRHHSHAELVCRCLEAGVATFVEKPLALREDELARVLDVARATGNDRLMVGFNRRFSPLLADLRRRFGDPGGPGVVRYHVNAGQLGGRSWYRDEAREGSRFVGEGGHFLDTLAWWLGARPVTVHATSTPDRRDLHVSVGFDDGSIGSVDYVTGGAARFPKETFEASAGQRTARLENFRRSTLWVGRRRDGRRAWGSVDKGQSAQLARFLDAVRSGDAMPIPLAELAATTAATLAVERSLAADATVRP